jgi:glycine oxidase
LNLKYDYLIVGQGLAGSMLYWFLKRQKKKVCVIDAFNPTSSSNIAAGIIHPVTGRRIVKTWMADILIPFAANTYSEIENHFGEKLFSHVNILELIHSAKEQNDWSNKMASEEMKDYIIDSDSTDIYNEVLVGCPKKIIVAKSGWLNISKMTGLFRMEMASLDHLIEGDFDFNALQLHDDKISYKDIEAAKIIFCEGANATQNPFWKHLPFLPSKGELLTIRSRKLKIDHIITKTIFILPLGENLYKVGSTYSWDELNEIPTEKAKENLLSKLKTIISVPFEVVDHKAAIRPTVKERRPFIGMHPERRQVGIFNGLGTKGVLLAPFFANHFSEHLTGKTELIQEIDVSRFS